MAIEIVDFPMKNGGSFHCYVTVHQRVYRCAQLFFSAFCWMMLVIKLSADLLLSVGDVQTKP